jgi:archaeosortase B (VPXXXP-CTERM-specific)
MKRDNQRAENFKESEPEGKPAKTGISVKAIWANPAYRFVILFLVCLGLVALFYILLTTRYFAIVEAMMNGTAWIVSTILSIFTADVTADGKMVVFKTFPVKIIEECTGIYEMLIFTAAVMAFPTGIKNKISGLSFGIPLMYLFNVVRIIALMIVGNYAYSVFNFMHLYFWQVTLILMITSVWVVWIIKVVKRGEETPASGG